MKLVAILLSIITLTLSAITCDDQSSYGAERLTSISQSSDHTSNNGFDLCSPFFTCASCAGITLVPNIQQDAPIISEITSKELNTFYTVSFSSNYLSLIFQPPQV